MSDQNKTTPKPDYVESTEVAGTQSARTREKAEPGAERASIPSWVLVVMACIVFGVVLAAGSLLGAYSKGWDITKTNPFPDYAPADPRPQDGGGAGADLTPMEAAMKLGKKRFGNCAGCHMAEGQGQPGVYPPLAGSEWVTGSTEPLAMVVLHGLVGEIEVAGATYNFPGGMQGLGGALGDEDIAAVLTYIRNSWGNQGSMVTPEMIAKARGDWATQEGQFTADDLKANDRDLEAAAAEPAG